MLLSYLLAFGFLVADEEKALPKLEKIWRTDLGGRSFGLSLTKDGQLMVNVRVIKWKGDQFVGEYDRVQSLCTAGTHERLMHFPDKTRGQVFGLDGKSCLILKGYHGHDLELWDIPGKKAMGSTSFGFGQAMFSLPSLSWDGAQALVSRNGQVELWELPGLTKKESLASPKENLWLSQLLMTPEGRLLGVYGRNVNYSGQPGDAVIWDFRAQKMIRTVKLSISPRYLQLSADGKHLAAGSENGTIWIWETTCTDEHPKYTLEGHSKPFTRIVFNPAGKSVATASLDSSVMLWDLSTQKATAKNTFPKNGLPLDALFTADGQALAVQGHIQAKAPDGKSHRWEAFVTLLRVK